MRELRFLWISNGIVSAVPLLGLLLTPVWAQYLLLTDGGPFVTMKIYSQIGNVLPLFACIWPILSLRSAVTEEGGELFFIWKRSAAWWIRRTGLLILLYALAAGLVATGTMLQVGSVGAGLLSRVGLLCFVYGFLGFFVMLWTKDLLWSFSLCLFYFLVMVNGRIFVEMPVNPHRISITDYFHAFPFPVLMISAGTVLFFLLASEYRRRRML